LKSLPQKLLVWLPNTCRATTPSWRPIIEAAGIATITPHKNYYQELVESIISQQLSVKAAATILKRFVGLFRGSDFPTPDQILEKDIDGLRTAGLSRQKASYIQDIARKVLDGTVRFNHLDSLSNDAVTAELIQINRCWFVDRPYVFNILYGTAGRITEW